MITPQLTKRIKRFFVAGLSAAIVNLLLMILFVEVFKFKTYFLKNAANVLSIGISIVYHFILSRLWTWKDAPQKKGKGLIIQFISFNIANFTVMAVRIILFAILEKMGVFYVLNVVFGIVLAATVSFILYERFVFNRRTD